MTIVNQLPELLTVAALGATLGIFAAAILSELLQ